MKILIVDDDKINGEMLAKRLNKRGFETFRVEDGMACIEFIEENEVDLVLLDIMMPDLSGNEVLTILREFHSPFQLPIIMVTAKHEARDIVTSLKQGANDYIQKPVNIDVAIARINTQGSLRELYQENLRKTQVETLNAMIVTYNHEINNPLTVAMGTLQLAMKDPTEERMMTIKGSLMRITEIVRKIETVTENGEIKQEDYTDGKKMVSLG